MVENEVKKEKKDDNVVFVGDKPIYLYCKAIDMVIKRFQSAVIKTRGSFITKAVNIAEIAKREYGAVIKEIKTDSQKFTNKENKEVTISTIEITITKK